MQEPLQFRYGVRIQDKDLPYEPGTIYLDVAMRELWIDDPTNYVGGEHIKIIDSDTLIYSINEGESILFPMTDESSYARLGTALPGLMKLGTPQT